MDLECSLSANDDADDRQTLEIKGVDAASTQTSPYNWKSLRVRDKGLLAADTLFRQAAEAALQGDLAARGLYEAQAWIALRAVLMRYFTGTPSPTEDRKRSPDDAETLNGQPWRVALQNLEYYGKAALGQPAKGYAINEVNSYLDVTGPSKGDRGKITDWYYNAELSVQAMADRRESAFPPFVLK